MKNHQRFLPSVIGLFFGTLFSVTIASVGQATPIPFNGGTLDASLRLYDFMASPRSFVLRKDYVLGTDFFPGVPPSTTVYHQEFGLHQALWNEDALETACIGSPFDFNLAGLNPHTFAWLAIRGGCTFDEKWLNIQNHLFGAGILVNDAPGPIGAVGGISSNVTIPFFRVTDVVGAELLGFSCVLDDPGSRCNLFPFIEMFVTWTPDDVGNAPEPATLALLGLGLTGLGFSRRKCAR